MFLTDEDYSVTSDELTTDVLTQSDTTTRLKAERVAMEEVSSYLRSRYDMEKAFAMTGDQRNGKLVQITVDIALYYLAHALAQNMGIESRENLYKSSIAWLKDVQIGKASPDLPTYTGSDGESDIKNPFKFGGMKANRYDY